VGNGTTALGIVKQFGQPPFFRKPLAVVAFGLLGEQVGGGDQGEGVGV